MTMPRTALFTDERTFWHHTGMQALFLPVGGWVQPPAAGVGADTPESKRRILSLVQVSGLADHMVQPRAEPATEADLLRVHTARYIEEFRAASAQGWADIGDVAPFGPGRLVVIHEGGYAEAYVPFCGLAMLESLAGVRTEAADPVLDMLIAQQPSSHTLAFQLDVVDRLAGHFGA
eukprot:gene8557-8649_t